MKNEPQRRGERGDSLEKRENKGKWIFAGAYGDTPLSFSRLNAEG
jgi:hypothetical protein